MVDTRVELILIVGFHGGTDEVVGGAGKIGEREVRQHLLRDCIEATRGGCPSRHRSLNVGTVLKQPA